MSEEMSDLEHLTSRVARLEQKEKQLIEMLKGFLRMFNHIQEALEELGAK